MLAHCHGVLAHNPAAWIVKVTGVMFPVFYQNKHADESQTSNQRTSTNNVPPITVSLHTHVTYFR